VKMAICDDLLHPGRLWSRREVLSRISPVPNAPGVYAWYFRNMPPVVPTSGCTSIGNFHLLYVGISPSAPPTNGKATSKQTLSRRIRSHLRGNASGSTLRLSLGCILAERLGIALRRVGRKGRFTFSAGEQRLSEWMEENARVVWKVCEEPWKLEERLISTLHLPLNLDQNTGDEFFPVLSGLRKAARVRARTLPILPK
jgi:hypothetical protein